MMTESKVETTKNTDLPKKNDQGFQIDISKEHGNWLNVGELIRSIQKPISIYVDEIVQKLHEKLCKDLLPVGKCSTPEDCNKKNKPNNPCKSCNSWFKKLAESHEKCNNPTWYKNCESAKWFEDHWEVAKFFMPALGSNVSTKKDAKSTDISSLLNVLEWLNNGAFLGKTRVKVEFVRDLRNQVRNTWAHAPQQELSDHEITQCFFIATNFLEDLEKVWSHAENEKCLKHLANLKTSRVADVVESELQSLVLQRHLLNDMKEEITKIRSFNQSTIQEHEQRLQNLERALNECSRRMSDFESFKDNMNEQFNNFAKDLKSFRAIPEDIQEIRNSIGQNRDDLVLMNKRQEVEREPTSVLPDRLPNFTARVTEIQKVISFIDSEKAVVSLHGGPGFGKTAIANEVSHKLSEDNIPVVFSHLPNATNVDEIIRQLCLHLGINHENEDPKSSLILWLKNIKSKVIFVMDDIDNLLDREDKSTAFYEFVGFLRKNSNQHCQIVTTSRIAYKIDDVESGDVKVEEMDEKECIELLKNYCPEQGDEFLQKLAELCGKIALAMCIAASRVDDFDDSNELLQHLQQQPMRILKCPKINKHVDRAVNMSYEKCSDEEKETLNRLAVFDGSFDAGAARAVNEKDNLTITDSIKTLVRRSLIEQPLEHRYSIHLLIKHFLLEQRNGENEIAERAKAQAMRAKLLMVKYYLKFGHDLTIKSYSKDEYKENREALKKEADNIQNVLKICCQQNDLTTSDISDCLANSKVYTTSARHFSLFIRTIIPGSTIDIFLQRCANMAEERKQHAIKINFDCLLADQERIKSIGKTDTVDFDAKMTEIQEDFKTHQEDLKEDKLLCAHYNYQCGRYLLRKAENQTGKKRQTMQHEACKQLEESLKLRRSSTSKVQKHTKIADDVFSLLQLGNAQKKIAATEMHFKHTNNFKQAMDKAQKSYEKAIQLSEENLGKHELTASCYKNLGDLLIKNKPELAEKNYITAKTMRDYLDLNASKTHVFLLNNLGQCLIKNDRANEAVEILESACDMAEKLPESERQNVCKPRVYTSLALAYDAAGKNINAKHYAEKALEFEDAIYENAREKLRKILWTNVD